MAAMKALSIGQIGKMTGLAPSAIRYYEKAGLMPKPGRLSPESVGRLRIVRVARDAGFTIAETRTFLSGFSATVRPAARWRALAEKKLAEIDAAIKRFAQMKELLESSFRCKCPHIEDCDRAIAADCGRPEGTRLNRSSG
jgi:MerR family transcriptional regulator, redox-sensitive transcriptional activator SoxR